MFRFPRTNTAYNLASEYCTIQRILDYQEAHFAIKGGKTKVHTNGVCQFALDSFHTMADEFRDIMKGKNNYLKEKIVIALRKYAVDDRLVHFRIAATNIIEDFNAPFPIKIIQTGEVLSDYFKDGFIVAHDFVSTANYLLKDYIDPSLLIHPEEDKEPLQVKSFKTKSVKKIKTKFTVGQLAYLFRLLDDNEFTHTDSLADLAKFLVKHFQNNRTSEFDLDNTKNLLSTPLKKDADKVADWLKELMIKARNFEVKPKK